MAIAPFTLPFTLHCANARCQAPNSSHDIACNRCGKPLTRRYLWVAGAGQLPQGQNGLIQDRYYRMGDERVVLDIRPGLLPEIPPPGEVLPAGFTPYLRLFAYRFAIPQIYGLLNGAGSSLFLLENAPLYPQHGLATKADGSRHLAEGQLMPTLAEAWPLATPQRQLGWLWQLVRLWAPLVREGVAATLLQTDLIRVEGAAVRLLTLKTDASPPTLDQLASLWLPLAVTAHTSIAPFLSGLIERLSGGAIAEVEPLLLLLDRALALACEGQAVELQVATCSDAGPQRQQNEDACLPKGGTFRITRPGHQSLTLVCDGLGGHDGGEVASQLSADSIHRYLQTPENLENTTPGIAMQRSVYQANELLLQRNNDEKRYLRQRMGTTVVMSWMVKHLMYLGHVGDSRIYRISPAGCTQLTLDDDVASQAVSQGQTVYRHAVRPSAAGALTQALGITETEHLRPTIQRFFFDDETVLLLCSDGLSDRDRVSEVWGQILLPVFTKNINVAVSAMQLLQAANQLNGHDNSTIALVHCQVTDQPFPDSQALLKLLDGFPLAARAAATAAAQTTAKGERGSKGRRLAETASGNRKAARPAPQRPPRKRWFGLISLAGGLLGLGTALGLSYQRSSPEGPQSSTLGIEVIGASNPSLGERASHHLGQ